MNKLIEPKEIKIRDKTFTISKFTATDGREIIAKYVMAALPKIGDYVINEAMMYKMMGYVSVRVGDVDICLTTKELVNNHTTSWDLLRELENAILEYNNFFFYTYRMPKYLQRNHSENIGVDFENIDGFIGCIIASGKATLHELKTIYSLEDAFLMWDVITTVKNNEYLAIQQANKKGG